jgi:hypothetical protein
MVLRLAGLAAPHDMRWDESDALALAIAGVGQITRPGRAHATGRATGRRISPVVEAVLASSRRR